MGYIRGSAFLSLILILYPFCWGLSEGGNVLSPSGEMVFYGILDLTVGVGVLFYFIFGLRDVDYEEFGFRSSKYTDAFGPEGGAVTSPSPAPAQTTATNVEKPPPSGNPPAAAPAAAPAPATGTAAV